MKCLLTLLLLLHSGLIYSDVDQAGVIIPNSTIKASDIDSQFKFINNLLELKGFSRKEFTEITAGSPISKNTIISNFQKITEATIPVNLGSEVKSSELNSLFLNAKNILESLQMRSIVGVWQMIEDPETNTRTIINFKEDGSYHLTSFGVADSTGHPGTEQGTYTWNSNNGLLVATVTNDLNGDWGLSHPKGNYYFMVNNDGSAIRLVEGAIGGETYGFFYPYVHPIQNIAPLYGVWRFTEGSEYVQLTFREDGTYTQCQVGEDDHPWGWSGCESGNYSWEETTGVLSATPTDDQNGDWGLSHPEGPYVFNVIQGTSGPELVLSIHGVIWTTFLPYVDPPQNITPIYGVWQFSDESESVQLTFREDGTYTQCQVGEDDHPWGWSGCESGNYSWDSATGVLSATPTDDQNGDWGLSHPEGPYVFNVIQGTSGPELVLSIHGVIWTTLLPYEEPKFSLNRTITSLSPDETASGEVQISSAGLLLSATGPTQKSSSLKNSVPSIPRDVMKNFRVTVTYDVISNRGEWSFSLGASTKQGGNPPGIIGYTSHMPSTEGTHTYSWDTGDIMTSQRCIGSNCTAFSFNIHVRNTGYSPNKPTTQIRIISYSIEEL